MAWVGWIAGMVRMQFVEVPIPNPGKGQMLVKVEAVSVNPADWRIQDGIARPFLPLRFPSVPGTDVAGEVVKLGPAVSGFCPGDKIIAYLHVLKGGGFAEYAIASAERTVHRPSGVSAAEGACAVVAGYTALQSARQAGLKSFAGGSEHLNVLIPGASGGVGVLLLQLVKLAGAHATVTCGERNMELMRSLQADEVLDYRTPEGANFESPSGRKYHIVLNCAHFVPVSKFAEQMQPRQGKVVDLTPTLAGILDIAWNRVRRALARGSGAQSENFYLSDNLQDLETLMELMSAGKLKAVVDSSFPLSRAGDAWDRSMGRHSAGKILVCPTSSI